MRTEIPRNDNGCPSGGSPDKVSPGGWLHLVKFFQGAEMKYELQDNLGLFDAKKCNRDFGASLPLEPSEISRGSIVDLPEAAAAYLTNPKSKGGRGLRSLLTPAGKIKGEAKDAEIKTPAK